MKGIEQDLFTPPSSDATIVECPSCKTKFSLEPLALTEAINEVEEPYFHCSKCDYVFQSINGNRRIDASFLSSPLAATSPQEEQVTLDFASKRMHPPRAQVNTDLNLDEPLTRRPTRTEPLLIDNPEAQQRSLRTFGIAAAVPAVSLLIILLISALCLINPGVSNRLVSITEKLQTTAPQSAYLQNLNIEKVLLADGEKLAFITGEIVNDGDQALKGVVIEGEVFDVNGNPLKASSTDLIKIKRDNLSLLTGAAIKERARASESELNVSAKSQESFILPIEDDLGKARYFAARIFSVEKNS